MARIIVSATMVRYPLGGMNLWVLTWLRGFHELGHEVYLVEKSGWPLSCYDPSKGMMSDDCSYGVTIVNTLLTRFGLGDRWCFVDIAGHYHGLSQARVEEVFKTADLFVDLEWNEWLAEAANIRPRVFVDGEPGWFQMKLENSLAAGEELPAYDVYYTVGRNIGTRRGTAPTAGQLWRPIFPPVSGDLLCSCPFDEGVPFTTVMNWQSHQCVEFNGITYGQKDVEFMKFIDLPSRTTIPLEVAVSGQNVPREQLRSSGWRVQNADDVAMSIDAYLQYILASKGEFGVCKNVFAATQCGWFGDRSGYYLAAGRPVVLQDTGFSAHLPCGRGLFAVRTVDEAAAAINEISGDYERHARWARDIAMDYLDARKVLEGFLREIGV